MQEIADDTDKYFFYLNAKFEIFDSLIFSSIVKKPSKKELSRIKSKLNKIEIERLYNHFHMSAISANIKKQRECVIEIWQQWRLFFDCEMKNTDVIIEIYDSKNEIIIYVYEKENL